MPATWPRSVDPRIVDVSVTLPRLPRALDGFTIAQITDVHVGPTVSKGFLAEVVRRVNTIAPDLVAITGDLVDGSIRRFGDRVEPLADLRSPTYFVTGNHEYYSGVDAWLPHLREHGVRVLRNERVEIARGGEHFYLAGIDDHESGRFGGDHGPDLGRALDGRDESKTVVLMAHQPRQVKMAAAHGVDFQLSGHTHGGQIWPWHGIARMQQGGLLAGLYKMGETQLYVSRGTGYVGPPVRIRAPAEITRIMLRAA